MMTETSGKGGDVFKKSGSSSVHTNITFSVPSSHINRIELTEEAHSLHSLPREWIHLSVPLKITKLRGQIPLWQENRPLLPS